jgi:hypothetical protein
VQIIKKSINLKNLLIFNFDLINTIIINECACQVIKSHVNTTDSLMVADPKLGSAIKEKFNISCVSSSSAGDLLRCIRSQFENLLVGLPKKDLTAMSLGLAHRYSLMFHYRSSVYECILFITVYHVTSLNLALTKLIQ